MKTTKARLKIRDGRRWIVKDIDIPADQEIMCLAERLHAARQAHREDIGDWVVTYSPSRTHPCITTTTWPRTGAVEISDEPVKIVAHFEIRYGDRFHPFWRISLAWINGDDEPPYQHRDDKNLLPPLDATQPSLFAINADLPQVTLEAVSSLFEGTTYQTEATAYERNPEARRQCIVHYGQRCVACGFDFGVAYGPVARGFIHVHHLVPLSEIGEAYTVDPIADLNPLCPNCHAVAHLRTPPYTVQEIKAFLAAREAIP